MSALSYGFDSTILKPKLNSQAIKPIPKIKRVGLTKAYKDKLLVFCTSTALPTTPESPIGGRVGTLIEPELPEPPMGGGGGKEPEPPGGRAGTSRGAGLLEIV